jgi:hypothetical protein
MNWDTLQGKVMNIGELNTVNPPCGADKVVGRGGVGEVLLEHGFWGLVKCGFLIGWISCIPSIADGVVGVEGMGSVPFVG